MANTSPTGFMVIWGIKPINPSERG